MSKPDVVWKTLKKIIRDYDFKINNISKKFGYIVVDIPNVTKQNKELLTKGFLFPTKR